MTKQKNSQYEQFQMKNFAKYIISQTSYTKEISENIVRKNLRRNIFVKRTIFAKKNSIKKFVEKNFRKKNFSKKKKLGKNFKNNFGNFIHI